MAKSLTSRRLVVLLAAMLALALAASAPALAQPEEPPPPEPRAGQEEAEPQPQQKEGQQKGSEAGPKADPETEEPETEESQPSEVSATGTIGQLADYPGATHGIRDELTGVEYALRSDAMDLDAYAVSGQRVTIRGVPVSQGSANPVINVTAVVPADGGSNQEDKATLSFELTVAGDPPAGAAFYGNVSTGEGGKWLHVPLADPDDDGVYEGSTTVDRFGPGPRPVPPGVEPVSLPVQILQGSEVIKDFGTVKLDGDKTFSASVSFDDDEPGQPANGLRGTITEISGSTLFVEEDPSDESGEKGYYSVTDETEILRLVGGDAVAPAAFEDLEVGQLVEAAYDYDGPSLPVIPPVGNAASITILEGDDGGDGRRFGSAAGTLERLETKPVVVDGKQICELSTHAINDEATGLRYDLISDAVDLDAYVGERVTAYGELLVSPKAVGTERCPDLDVTRIERLGNPPPGDGGSDNDGSGGGSFGGVAGGIRGLLPSTGGGTALWVLGAGVLLVSGGLLVRRIFGQ